MQVRLVREVQVLFRHAHSYLDPLDHRMAARGFEMVRYADDFVVLCRSPQDAADALAEMQQWTAEAGLRLHPTETRLVNAQEDGFDFLGYHFEAGHRWPRKKSLMKFKDTIRAKTKRTSGQSLPTIIRQYAVDGARSGAPGSEQT